MSSSDAGQLAITATTPGTLLRVFDARLRETAWGREYLNTDVPAGVNQIEARLGDVSETRLVMVKPGATERLEMKVDFPAVAPVLGLASTTRSHTVFSTWLSERIAQLDGPTAGVAVVLRNVAAQSKLRVDSVELLDGNMNRIDYWPDQWFLAPDGDIAGKAERLPPGPYILRTRRDSSANAVPHPVDQTIWLAPGWQTLAFLENQPFGADARGMSVHMAPISESWRADAAVALALEAALAGLRSGVDCSSPRELRQQTHEEMHNPMFAIASLHGLLLQARPDREFFRYLIQKLFEQVGSHPDVLALAAAHQLIHDEEALRGPVSVTWPPMFERSYKSYLLAADLLDENVIPRNSPAERVAPYLRAPGPWLQWSQTDQIFVDDVDLGEPRAFLHDTFHGAEGDHADLSSPRIPAPDEAIRQVEKALTDLSEFNGLDRREVLEEIGTASLAHRLKLPETLVKSALLDLGEQLPGRVLQPN